MGLVPLLLLLLLLLSNYYFIAAAAPATSNDYSQWILILDWKRYDSNWWEGKEQVRGRRRQTC